MTIQLSMFGAKYDGKQADLFVAPVSPTAPAPPAEPEAAPKAPALVFRFGGVEIHRQACCPECGDPLPAKAKACPNCYTKRTEYNAEDMARAIWAEPLAKSDA